MIDGNNPFGIYSLSAGLRTGKLIYEKNSVKRYGSDLYFKLCERLLIVLVKLKPLMKTRECIYRMRN